MQEYDKGQVAGRPAAREAFERLRVRYQRMPRAGRKVCAAVVFAGAMAVALLAQWSLPETFVVVVAALALAALAMRNPRVAATALVLVAWLWVLSIVRSTYPPGATIELALALLGLLVAVAAHHLVSRLPPWQTAALSLLAAAVVGSAAVWALPSVGVVPAYVAAFAVVAYRWVVARRAARTAAASATSAASEWVAKTSAAGASAPPAVERSPGHADRAGGDAVAARSEEPPPPITVQEAMAELDAMIGLEPVKRQVRALAASIEAARLRTEAGLPTDKPLRHFVFLGPPGTGKTTVARVMAKIFYAFGSLPRPTVVEAQRADLVAEYVGGTAIKTNELVDRALGGVLFIDEAYALANRADGHGDRFGAEAVQTLLKRAEDDRDRLVIILAGYQQQMEEFLDSNPGLGSRFGTRIRFPSYGTAELLSIAESLITARGDRLDPEAGAPLREAFQDVWRRGIVDDLGNGRFVRSLVEAAAAARDVRVVGDGAKAGGDEPGVPSPARGRKIALRAPKGRNAPETARQAHGAAQELVTLRAEDIRAAFAEVTSRFRGYAPQPSLRDALAEMDRLIGLEPVKEQVRAIAAQLRVAGMRQAQGLPAQPPMRHFVFVGPPGTGKTTVARVLGRVFAALGLIPRPEVLEVQRADLVAEHLGATAIKTNRLIDRALGGVLFIDEAYSLVGEGYSGGDAFGSEAVQALLKRAEDDRDRLVVVLAGYPQAMDAFLARNPGLSSRFVTRVTFPSHGPDELRSVAALLAADAGDRFDAEALDHLDAAFTEVCDRGWVDELGNGRFARSLYERACAARDVRIAAREEAATAADLTTVTGADVREAYQELTARLRGAAS